MVKIYTAKNGAKYIKLANGQCRFISQKGRGMLAKGISGCVYRPGLISREEGRPPANRVSKLMYKAQADKERDELEKIKIIDPEGRFTLANYKLLNPNGVTEDGDGDINNRCLKWIESTDMRVLSPGETYENCQRGAEECAYRLLNLDYGGDTLLEIGGFDDNFYRALLPIFEGLVLLSHNNLVHHDIKAANILYNGVKMILIDWGHAINMDKIGGPDDVFRGHYGAPNWPLDLTDLKRKGKDPRFIYKSTIRERIKNENADFWKNLRSYGLNREGIYNIHGSKYDTYSLGMTLLMLRSQTDSNRDREAAFIQILHRMTHGNMIHRLSPEQALNQYQEFLRDYGDGDGDGGGGGGAAAAGAGGPPERERVVNPLTGREIIFGGATWQRLTMTEKLGTVTNAQGRRILANKGGFSGGTPFFLGAYFRTWTGAAGEDTFGEILSANLEEDQELDDEDNKDVRETAEEIFRFLIS